MKLDKLSIRAWAINRRGQSTMKVFKFTTNDLDRVSEKKSSFYFTGIMGPSLICFHNRMVYFDY